MSASYPRIRLFVEPELSPPFQRSLEIVIEGEQALYLTRVMRLKTGDVVALFNGRDGEWRAELIDGSKKRVRLRLGDYLREYLAPPDVWVCFAPIKFGRIDYLVQKVTELGAAKLQPVLTQHVQSERINEKRLRANAIEAAEQCERVEVPQIDSPIQLRQLIADWPDDRVLLFADESGQGNPIQTITASESPDKYGILIGPEGGFTAEEREMLYAMKQTRGVSLGPRILRADTAAVTLLSITQAAWGDWDIAPHFEREAQETRDAV